MCRLKCKWTRRKESVDQQRTRAVAQLFRWRRGSLGVVVSEFVGFEGFAEECGCSLRQSRSIRTRFKYFGQVREVASIPGELNKKNPENYIPNAGSRYLVTIR